MIFYEVVQVVEELFVLIGELIGPKKHIVDLPKLGAPKTQAVFFNMFPAGFEEFLPFGDGDAPIDTGGDQFGLNGARSDSQSEGPCLIPHLAAMEKIDGDLIECLRFTERLPFGQTAAEHGDRFFGLFEPNLHRLLLGVGLAIEFF